MGNQWIDRNNHRLWSTASSFRTLSIAASHAMECSDTATRNLTDVPHFSLSISPTEKDDAGVYSCMFSTHTPIAIIARIKNHFRKINSYTKWPSFHKLRRIRREFKKWNPGIASNEIGASSSSALVEVRDVAPHFPALALPAKIFAVKGSSLVREATRPHRSPNFAFIFQS